MATTTRHTGTGRRAGLAAWHAISGSRDRQVSAVGQRCECTGQCERDHRREHDGRCHVIDGPGRRLVIAPAAPGLAWTLAARLPGDALRVWCPTCLTEAERAARRHQATERATQQDDLFAATPADPERPDRTDKTDKTHPANTAPTATATSGDLDPPTG